MEINVQAVRVYGSKSQYGSTPRTNLSDEPITLIDYPSEGETCSVFLGDLPVHIATAYSVRKALGISCLQALFIKREVDDPDAHLTLLSEDPKYQFPKENWNYYVTVLLERRVTIENSELEQRRNVWVEHDTAKRIADELQSYSKTCLNRLASHLSVSLGMDFLKNLVFDRVVFCAPDRVPFSLPDYSVSTPTVAITHSVDEIEFPRLSGSLRSLAKLSAQDQKMLDPVRFWYLNSLREKDTWRKFASSFLALEILANKLGSKFYGEVVGAIGLFANENSAVTNSSGAVAELLVDENELSLRGRFAVMAIALTCQTANEDVETFQKLKTVRDKLSHGSLTDTDALPIGEAQSLLHRYLAAASERLKLGS